MKVNWINLIGLLTLAITAAFPAMDDALPKPIFYLPLDGSTEAAVSGGASWESSTAHAEPILTLAEWRRTRFIAGKVGTCCEIADAPLVYRCAGNFRPDEGACAFWIQPQFRGD
ncbi:MAG: hypothetical protein NTX50_28770, partial [Candidatus Sumerlaeota bacterium]|nr:hypothetical protein [Candidatus Sumerlaeota bacterium]